MPRKAGGLIEAMRQEALTKAGESDTDYRITAKDIQETSEKAKVTDQALDAQMDAGPKDRPVVQTISVNKMVPIYRRAYDVMGKEIKGVYVLRLIPYGNVANCLRKTEPKSDRRVFFRDTELNGIHANDGGWRVWTSEDNKFPCWSEGCAKRLPSVEQLYNHIRDTHANVFPHYAIHLQQLLRNQAATRLADVNEKLRGTGLSIEKLDANIPVAPKDAEPNTDLPGAPVDNRPFVSTEVPIPVVDDPSFETHAPPPGFRTEDQGN